MYQIQQEIGMCSARGVSAPLEQSADGYVRSEAIACVLLQKRSTAKRIYGTVMSSKVNVDGRKNTGGLFYPSSEAQEELMIQSYKEANIDPLRLTYFEGHLTGTKV